MATPPIIIHNTHPKKLSFAPPKPYHLETPLITNPYKCSLQKINHFPSMSEICRKDTLARNMNRMCKLFPKDYNVFPKSWCLPAELVYLSFPLFSPLLSSLLSPPLFLPLFYYQRL